ncbi:MAG: hypothetical protein KY433_08480, partial [Actinobacteria bacterium]|nr:hypothetical protein [Actinomycetota bacterium]
PDGRLQRLRQAIGHPGEVRQPALVLAELCGRLGAPVDALTTPMVTEQVSAAVPFYAGITLEEIGGRGVRWQERDAASALEAPEIPDEPLEDPPTLPEGMKLGTVRSLWAGRETKHAPALRFLEPLQTSYGPLAEREILELQVEGADGVCGRGEAAPLEPYDGVSLARARAALEAYRPILQDGDALQGGELLDACRAADDLPQALAAVDMALWDRAGRRAGRPVAQLLTAPVLQQVPVNATIGAEDRAGARARAEAARRDGFRCVKLKVGIGDDAGRVAAVRAALGTEVELRLDANGAWSVEQAVATIDALASAGLELVEEPVHGLAALREVRERVAVRVAMDESAAEPGALASGAADAVCLKLTRCGGISGLLACASLVRASGAEPYVASTFDGPLGVAAAVHAAAALRIRAACGLATLSLFADLDHPLAVRGGAIEVPRGPGLL